MIAWLIVSVVWTIGAVQLEDFIKDKSVCIEDEFVSKDDDNFAQAYVAIVSIYIGQLVVLRTQLAHKKFHLAHTI